MREIKFKAIYQSPHTDEPNKLLISKPYTLEYLLSDNPQIDWENDDGYLMLTEMEEEYTRWIEYAGLLDKNGEEMFEGDRVKFYQNDVFCKNKECAENDSVGIGKFCPDCGTELKREKYSTVAEIIFKEGAFCLSYEDEGREMLWTIYIAERYIKGIEIIGNIYENKT